MSKEAFCETASYDAMIYNYFNSLNKNINDAPKKLILNANLVQKLRYGENPHQFGAIYSNNENFKLKKLQGKDLSYNNYNDIFASINLAKTPSLDLSCPKLFQTNIAPEFPPSIFGAI